MRAKHADDDAIIAKVWIIGRTYSAAIERRKPGKAQTPTGDEFYTDHVAPGIRNSPMDKWLARLKPLGSVNHNSLPQILDVHAKVTELFRSLSGLNKRSLASKYLHFHFPKLFFYLRCTRRERSSKTLRHSHPDKRPWQSRQGIWPLCRPLPANPRSP